MNTKKVLLTKDGLKHLKKELNDLKQKKRVKAVARLTTARELGDLSENSEYSSAKEDLEFIDTRISEIEESLLNVEIIGLASKSGHQTVSLGSTVIVETNRGEDEYMIVGSLEADPMAGKISNESLVGQALLGRKTGDTVLVASSVKITYKIKAIK